jgi:hypothetical protein
VAALLAAPVAEERIERSPSGGVLCSYSTEHMTSGEGAFLMVAFDRSPNLALWRPGRSLDASAAYAQRRAELSGGDPGHDLPGIGLAAWLGDLGSALAVFAPDVLVELGYDPRAAPADAATALLVAIGAALDGATPAALDPVPACALLAVDDVQADLGVFVDEVDSYDPADPLAATLQVPAGGSGCAYTAADPIDPLGILAVAHVFRYRTTTLRAWLHSDVSIGVATEADRAAADDIDAAGWTLGYFVGDPLNVAGACQASWDGPGLFVLLDADDAAVVELAPELASQALAMRLGARLVSAALAERGAAASCGPFGTTDAMQRLAAFGRHPR